jgi:hypothetical protein
MRKCAASRMLALSPLVVRKSEVYRRSSAEEKIKCIYIYPHRSQGTCQYQGKMYRRKSRIVSNFFSKCIGLNATFV